MEHIIFSLNSVIPVFTIMEIGFYLRKKKILTGDFVSQAASLMLYTTLPVKLFLDVSRGSFSECLDTRFTAYLLIYACASFAVVQILCILPVKDKTTVNVVVHSAFRGNSVYLGLPVCRSILGRESVPSTITVVTFVLPFYNVLATVVLFYYNPLDRKVSWKKMLKDILTSPMIVAILAVLPFSLMHTSLPSAVSKALSYLGWFSTSMALILIGAGTRPSAFTSRGAWIMLGAAHEVVATLLLFTVPMLWLGFNPGQMVTASVMFVVPSAMDICIVTKKMGGDGELGAAVITVSILLSAVTLPARIWWLRFTGMA